MKSTSHERNNCAASLSAYTAYFYTVLSSVAFSMNSVLVRFARTTPSIQMSMYRFIGMMVFSLPLAVHTEHNLFGPKDSRKMLLYRAIPSVLTVIFAFISFSYLPIGEASAIIYCTPVFITIFAKFLLKEPCGLVQSITVGITLIGILFVLNPSSLLKEKNLRAIDHAIGVLSGLAALFCVCFMGIFTRLTRNVHYSVVCFSTSILGAVVCLLLAASTCNLVLPECGGMRWVAFAMGVSSSLGQIFYVKALQMENVGPLATLKSALDITIAIVWQVIIFQESLDDFAIGGVFLVLLSVFLVGFRKWVQLLPKDSSMKKTFKFLTY